MSITLRIKEFIDSRGIKAYKLEKDLDIGATTLTKAFNGDRSIGSDIIQKIVQHFPDLDPVWLLTGNKSAPQPQGEKKYLEIIAEREQERDKLKTDIELLTKRFSLLLTRLLSLEDYTLELGAERRKTSYDAEVEVLGISESDQLDLMQGTGIDADSYKKSKRNPSVPVMKG